MAMNSVAIANALRPGLKSLFADMETYPAQWKEIFSFNTSDKNFEQDLEMRLLGLGQFKPEGQSMYVDSGMGQRVLSTYFHRTLALSFAITEEAQEDNLYKSQFPQGAKALKASMLETKEYLAAAVLTNGSSTSYPGGDGQPLFSLSHPIDGGVYANRPTTFADLNEATLEAGIIATQQFKNQAGLITSIRAEKLIVPATGQFVAKRILGSQFRPGTANNDINAINMMDMIPKGFTVNQYLPLNNAWFILTSAQDGMKYFQRRPLKTDMYTDFDTKNLMCGATERYSFGWSNPRAMYASYGA
jgi:hypothetical protein